MGKGTANITVILKDNGQTETVTGTSVTSGADPKQDTKDFTIIVEPFPEVVSVIPAPGADNVPTGIYLELGFSQSMNPASVLASRLTITDVTGGDDVPSAHDANYSFDIQIGAAKDQGLVKLDWNSDYTILKLTSTHQLEPGNTYKLDLLTNQAHSDTGTEIAAKVNVPLILGPGTQTPKFIVQDSSGRRFTMPSARFTSGAAPVNLGSGFTFTTQAVGRTDQYPEVLWVTPSPGAGNVPTDVYLELGFSQPMHEGSVSDSTLRITDVDGGDDNPTAHEAGYYFDIQIGAAKDQG